MLPNSVDDYIGPDNPVRFVDAFVEQLDLQGAGFCRVEPNETGRPGYHPADLLKLYIYGYLNRVRSSRRLEAESRRNLEVMWLLRGLTPDFKTIADFRKDNRDAFKPVFRQFVLLCRKLELFASVREFRTGPKIPRLLTRQSTRGLSRSIRHRHIDKRSRNGVAPGPFHACRSPPILSRIGVMAKMEKKDFFGPRREAFVR